jgi:hypothetical protein
MIKFELASTEFPILICNFPVSQQMDASMLVDALF